MILTLKEALGELKEQYSSQRLIPFIGAGFSIPLNLPSWRQLIIDLGKDLGYDDDLYLLHGNYQQLAEYGKLVGDKKWSAFIQKMRVGFDSKESDEKRRNSKQHFSLSNLNVKTIYTTNYDPHIERAFEDKDQKVKTIITLKDFIQPDKENYDIEVIKFHGCLTDQDSIILTENQYYERMELEHPLDQRLRSDALSNSFLFIGYSFDDPNIRHIWYKIQQQIKRYLSNGNRAHPRPSYIVSFGKNEVQATILKELNIKSIALDPLDKEAQICELLDQIAK
jgi:hypothetical protein